MTNTKKLAFSGLFAAVIFALTMFVKIPAVSGYIHLGDAMVYICACVIGGPWSIVAGALGEALADVAGGFSVYAPATIVVKSIVSALFILSEKRDKIINPFSSLLTLPVGLITVIGYFTADSFINEAYAFADIPGNIIQAIGSAAAFFIIGAALDKVNVKERITRG